MNNIVRVFLALALFSLCPQVSAAADPAPPAPEKGGAPPGYTISVIPFYSPEKIWVLYTPFIAYLRKTTGLPWELKPSHSHDALIEGLCSGEVSIALLGPVPLGRAIRKCGAETLLVALGKDGKPSYRSIVVTNDPGVSSLAGLAGKSFAFFKGSTAAHVVPAKMLRDAGVGLDALRPVFYESQDRIMTALLRREVAAAGVKESLYRKFRSEPLRVLKISDPLPNFAFCAAPNFNSRARNLFRAALSRLKPLTDERDAAAVKDWDDEIRSGFVLPSGEYLEAVQRVHRITGEILHEDR